MVCAFRFGCLIGCLILSNLAPKAWAQASPSDPQTASFQELSSQADALRRAGNTDEAKKLYQQAVALNPSWELGWWHLGTLLYDQQHHRDSRDAFRRLAALKPDAGPTWAFLGLSEFQLREYERSLKSLLTGRQHGFGGNRDLNFVAHYHLAILLARFGRFKAGLEILDTLSKHNPDNFKVIEAIGLNVLRFPALPTEIPADRREAVRLAGRGAYYSSLLDFDAAERHFEELVERFPDLPNVHLAQGSFLLKSKPDEALEAFQKELEVYPYNALATLQVANEYLSRGDPNAALSYAQRAEELDQELVMAKNTMGQAYLQKGDYLNAIQAFESGVQLEPETPEMFYGLYRAYARVGRTEDAQRARETFQKLQKEQQDPEAGKAATNPPPG